MTDLNALIIFAKVVEAKSFSEAARRLGMPISTVSRRVAELEDQLGVRLLDRSTRSLRLTDLGTEVLEQATRSVEINDAVESIVSNQLANVTGTLRLSAPPNISDTLLNAAGNRVPGFLPQCPRPYPDRRTLCRSHCRRRRHRVPAWCAQGFFAGGTKDIDLSASARGQPGLLEGSA